jgi:integrase
VSVAKTSNGGWRVKVKSKGLLVADQTFRLKRDADAYEAQQKRALSLGEFVDPKAGKTSLIEVVERWMESRAASVSNKTLQTEGYALKAHIPTTLGNRPVSSIRTADLDALYASMLHKVSRSTVARFRNTLSSLFGWAVREQLIAKNPAIESRVPRGKGQDKKAEIYPYSLTELREVTADLTAKHPTLGPVALVLGLTGLRWGELVALRVRDVQLVPRPAFRVSRSASDGQEIRTVTKGGSERTVPLPAEVVRIVKPLTVNRDPDDLLFLSPRGERLNGPNWKRAVGWSTLGRGRREHDLRHTAATLWLSSGVDLKTAQKWLGHSTATLTADTYAHWLGDDADAAALAKMDAILGDHTGTSASNLRAQS